MGAMGDSMLRWAERYSLSMAVRSPGPMACGRTRRCSSGKPSGYRLTGGLPLVGFRGFACCWYETSLREKPPGEVATR